MLWADWAIPLHERSPAVDRPVGQASAALDGSGERHGSQGERLGTPRCVPRCSRHLGLWLRCDCLSLLSRVEPVERFTGA